MGIIYFAGGSVFLCFHPVVTLVFMPRALQTSVARTFLAAISENSRSQIVTENTPKK